MPATADRTDLRMRTIDSYVLRQTLKPLWIALVVGLLVLLVERMLRLLDLVLGAEGPLKVVFEIMAYLVPNYISLALPMSLLLGVMLAFNRLSRDGEIDALQGAGVSLARQSRAALLAAVGVAAITLITLGYLKPYGRYAYQTLVFTIGNAAFHTFVQAGVFTRIQDTTFLIKHVRTGDGAFANVFLYEGSGDDSTVVTARSGVLVAPGDGTTPMLRLFDGTRLTVHSGAAQAKQAGSRALPVGVLRFQELRMTLGESETKLFRSRGADEREFTLSELWQRRSQPPPGVRESDMRAEFHGRLARVLSVPFLPLLGIPLALGRRRSERSFGLAVGILVLIIYNQVLDFGENVAETGAIGPVLGLWLPVIVFASASVCMFRRASERLPRTLGYGTVSLPASLVGAIERTSAWMAGRRG
jgi:lipopolysaccharide export system permease protein